MMDDITQLNDRRVCDNGSGRMDYPVSVIVFSMTGLNEAPVTREAELPSNLATLMMAVKTKDRDAFFDNRVVKCHFTTRLSKKASAQRFATWLTNWGLLPVAAARIWRRRPAHNPFSDIALAFLYQLTKGVCRWISDIWKIRQNSPRFAIVETERLFCAYI